MTSQPTKLPNLREPPPQWALSRQVDKLRAAHKYAEAVPLAELCVEVIEAQEGSESFDVARALINLAELLIAADRSTEAEPLLQRALAIVLCHPGGGAALRMHFADIDTERLTQSVPALRSLLTHVGGSGVKFSLEGPRSRRRDDADDADPDPEATRRLIERLRAGAERRAAGRRDQDEEPSRQAPASPAPKAEKPKVYASTIPTGRGPDGRPDPSTPQGALAVEAGRLAYQISNRMWVGVQETVEVRLGAVIAKEIMQGFVGRGDVKLEHVSIVETMSVSLVCQRGTFDIEPRSNETQLVKPDLVKGTAFHQEDFARWIWLVTPRQRGKHTLFVKVSAAIRDSRGLPTTSSLPDKIIAVTVQVHLARAAVGVIRYIAPLILSGVITALVGAFTKDYWWPAVRSWLGW